MVVYGQLRKKKTDGDYQFLDYILMGRSLTLPMFTATLVATWYGGIFGVTQISFESGIYNFVTQGVFWYITYILFAFFLVHKIKAYNAVTLPEVAGKLFGPKSEKLSAIFNFFNVVPIAYAMSLGLFIQVLTGFDLLYATILGTGFVCLYSIFGGFRAVVFSDLVQFVVMCLAVFLVLIFSIFKFGGWGFLKSHLPETHFSLTGGHSLSTTFVWGFIALSTLVDPNFYQRCFAAKSDQVAKKGILISTIIWLVFDICTTFGAMYARAVMPEADSKQAYILYSLQILPNGLRGFFLAGILATILSTLDSYIFVASNTLSYDLFSHKLRDNIWWGYLSTVFVGGLAVFLSFYFEGSVKSVWKTLGSYSAGCLLFPMLVGYLKNHWISDRGFILSSMLGVLGITYWRFTSHTGVWSDVDDLYIGIFCTVIGVFFSKAVKI